MVEYAAVLWLFALLVLLFDVYVYYRFKYSHDVLEHTWKSRKKTSMEMLLAPLEESKKTIGEKAFGSDSQKSDSGDAGVVYENEFSAALSEFSTRFEYLANEIDLMKSKLSELQALQNTSRFSGDGAEFSPDLGLSEPPQGNKAT